MLIGKVIGTVVASQKDPKMEGLKFLVLQQMTMQGKAGKGYVVAVDSVGAGIGELVLYASGSSARQTQATQNRPCDAVIMAIIDSWHMDSDTVYNKAEEG